MSVKACVKPRPTLDHMDEDEPLVTRRAKLFQLSLGFKNSSSLLGPHKQCEEPGSDVQMQNDHSSSAVKENPILYSKPLVSETQKSSRPSSEDSQDGMTSSSGRGCKDSDDVVPLSSSDREDSKDKVPLDVLNDQSSGVFSDDEPLIFRKTKLSHLRSDLKESPSLFRPGKQLGKLSSDVRTPTYQDLNSLKVEMVQPLKGTQKLPLVSRQLMSHKEDCSNDEPDDSQDDVPLNSSGSDDPADDTIDMPLKQSDTENSKDDMPDSGSPSDQSSSLREDDEPLIFRKTKLNRLGSDSKKSTSSIRPYTQLGKLGADIQNDQGFRALKGEDFLCQKSPSSKPASGTQKSPPLSSSVQSTPPASARLSPSLPSSAAPHLKSYLANAVSSANHKTKKDTTIPVTKDHLNDEAENAQYDGPLGSSGTKNSGDDTQLRTSDADSSEDDAPLGVASNGQTTSAPGDDDDEPLVSRTSKLKLLGSVLTNPAPSIGPDHQLGTMAFDVGILNEQSSSAPSDDEPLAFRKLKLKQLSSDLKNSTPPIRPDKQLVKSGSDVRNPYGQNSNAMMGMVHRNGVLKREKENKNALVTSTKRNSADTSHYQSSVKKAKLSHAFTLAKVQQNPVEANAKDDDDHIPVAKWTNVAASVQVGEKTLATPVDVGSSCLCGSIPLCDHKGQLAEASAIEPKETSNTSLHATSAQAHEDHNKRLPESQYSQSSVDGSDSYGSRGRKHLSIESLRDIGKVSADRMNKGESNSRFGKEDSMCSCPHDASQTSWRKTAPLIDDEQSWTYKKELEKQKKENKQLKRRLNHAHEELLHIQKELLRINGAVQTLSDQLNLSFLTSEIASGAHGGGGGGGGDCNDNNDEVRDDGDCVGKNCGGGDDDA